MHRVTYVAETHPRIGNVATTRLLPVGDGAMSAFVVAGAKWNVGGVWLVHGNVMMPLTDSGLTARVIPSIAIDYSFAR